MTCRTKNHPDTALEELHPSDAMIELLKSGKTNNRLLCEMATHEGFRKLMADLEIYVDCMASMQLSNLNAIVEMARIEIKKKCNPGAEDQYTQTPKAVHIDKGNCFTHMVHDDVDVIAKDIRFAYMKDFDTAPEHLLLIRLGRELKKLPISKEVQK